LHEAHAVKADEIRRDWFVFDAEDKVLGRVASQVAQILKGKHKPIYSPHLDTGDHVSSSTSRRSGSRSKDKKKYFALDVPGR
jgi:large subunit ribosomal protein L13